MPHFQMYSSSGHIKRFYYGISFCSRSFIPLDLLNYSSFLPIFAPKKRRQKCFNLSDDSPKDKGALLAYNRQLHHKVTLTVNQLPNVRQTAHSLVHIPQTTLYQPWPGYLSTFSTVPPLSFTWHPHVGRQRVHRPPRAGHHAQVPRGEPDRGGDRRHHRGGRRGQGRRHRLRRVLHHDG